MNERAYCRKHHFEMFLLTNVLWTDEPLIIVSLSRYLFLGMGEDYCGEKLCLWQIYPGRLSDLCNPGMAATNCSPCPDHNARHTVLTFWLMVFLLWTGCTTIQHLKNTKQEIQCKWAKKWGQGGHSLIDGCSYATDQTRSNTRLMKERQSARISFALHWSPLAPGLGSTKPSWIFASVYVLRYDGIGIVTICTPQYVWIISGWGLVYHLLSLCSLQHKPRTIFLAC